DARRGRAEKEHGAGHARDREVLVEGADEGALGLGEDAIVGDFRDRAAALDGGHARAATAADDAVDAVAVEISGGLTGADRNALAEHLDDLVEVATVQFGVRCALAEEGEEVVLAPWLTGGRGDDLLGGH